MGLVKTAASFGTIVINHMKVTGFNKDGTGKLVFAHTTDTLSGLNYMVKARQFINAAGPYSDAIRMMANPAALKRIRVSRGVHITLPKHIMPGDTALLIPKTDDKRLIFVIPYRDVLLVGTTDADSTTEETEPMPTKREVGYLLNYVNRYFDIAFQAEQVLGAFSGLRPLLTNAAGQPTRELVRDHDVEIDMASDLISILGGKWTTYRLMAKDTIDTMELKLYSRISPCNTADQVISGGEGFNFKELFEFIHDDLDCPADIAEHLIAGYGTHARLIAKTPCKENPRFDRLVAGEPFTETELIYLLKNEIVCTASD